MINRLGEDIQNHLQNIFNSPSYLIFMRINNFTQYGERANYDFHMRLTKEQKERLIALANGSGFTTISGYIRFILFNPTFDIKLNRTLEIVKDIQEKANLIELSKKTK